MPLNINLVTGPTTEPVSLDLAKQHLKVDFPDEDDLITAYITAARQYCEKYTNRAFFNQTWMRTMDNFPVWLGNTSTINPVNRNSWPFFTSFWDRVTIDLPKPRTVSVTSITYIDGDGVTQTVDPSTYVVDITSTPARIMPANNFYWPEASVYIPGSVVVTFVAGSYGDGVETNTIPQTVVIAMLLLISHWYTNREASSALSLKNIPLGVNALLDTEKAMVFEYRPQ